MNNGFGSIAAYHMELALSIHTKTGDEALCNIYLCSYAKSILVWCKSVIEGVWIAWPVYPLLLTLTPSLKVHAGRKVLRRRVHSSMLDGVRVLPTVLCQPKRSATLARTIGNTRANGCPGR